MKIWPPLKVEIDNDMQIPPANPTSQNVNSVEEKTLANTDMQTHLSEWWKKTLKTLSSTNILPQFFLNPNLSSALINLSSHFFN